MYDKLSSVHENQILGQAQLAWIFPKIICGIIKLQHNTHDEIQPKGYWFYTISCDVKSEEKKRLNINIKKSS
jgi:hypothetical protein